MLIAKRPTDGQLIRASKWLDKEEYCCPVCGEPVILHCGNLVTPYFAHRPGSDCICGAGESAEHLRGKIQLFRWAEDHHWRPRLEEYLPTIEQRPDILLQVDGQPTALEFQCSPLSLTKLKQRNQGYDQLSLKYWWLLGNLYHRHLRSAKCAQFTELYNGRPALLFWNTQHNHLEIRDYRRVSFLPRQIKNRRLIIVGQTNRLGQMLHHRDRRLWQLAMAAYDQGHLLAACPLVAHDTRPRWPVSPTPLLLWRLTALIALAKCPLLSSWTELDWQKWLLSQNSWCQFPCLTDHGKSLIKQVVDDFTADLSRSGMIRAVNGKEIYVRQSTWFNSPEEKMALLMNKDFEP